MSNDYSRDGLLQLVRNVWTEHDPVPAGLVERMQAAVEAELAIAGTDLDVELLALISDEQMLAGARGTATYTLRFSSGDIDLLVRAVGDAEGRTRLDGWVSPAGPLTVRATPVPDTGASWEAESDDTGRFEFTELPTGMVRLHLTPRDAALKPFATPAFEI